jgi:hypothetical protein
MKKYLFLILLTAVLFACDGGAGSFRVDISGVPDPGIEIQRYGRDLFREDPDSIGSWLPELAEKYPFFLGEPPLDTLSYIRIHEFVTDPFLRELASACDSVYPDTDMLEQELNLAWRYYRYYYPEAAVPEVYSYVSGLDFEYPVQLHQGILLIALDMYLGKGQPFYAESGIPMYRSRRASPDFLVRDVMLEAAGSIPRQYREENILLDQIITKGKLLYFLDATLPDLHDSVKIAYSGEQLQWCIDNESNLWAFLIENELLFSSDYEKTYKLIVDGPFTSYFPSGSPARTGWWVGWQVVRRFMENSHDVSLPQLMEELTPRQVLDNSGYNP